MKISNKQYEFDEADPTLDQLKGALLERGYQVGEVREDDYRTTVWSLEKTSPARLSVPLCTVEWDCTTGVCQLVEFDKEPEEEDEYECPGCPDCGEEIEGSQESEQQVSLLEACSFISSVISGTAAALVQNGEQIVTWFDEDTEEILAGISLSGGEIAVYVSHNVDMKSFLSVRGYCDLLSLPITKKWPVE